MESTKSVATAYCIFEQFLNAEKIVVVLQPSAAAQRYAGSTHTVSGNCWHALGMHPHPRSHQSASGQFLVCYHALLVRTQILQIRDCQEQRRTLRARRHALRIHELIRLHVRLPESYGILPESKNTLRSAPHSVIAIFRYSQRLYRRNLMKNPG